jgi:hypothetical protein
LLGVHGLGPGRTVERIRWRETVYTIYRQEKSLVLLESEAYCAQEHGPAAARGRGLPGWIADRLPRRPD